MANIELTDDLIALERAAWAEQQEGRLTVATAARVPQATKVQTGTLTCGEYTTTTVKVSCV
ncbi:hypothetical protein OG413_19685 [Streptomyces sp. NBC_01433]|uniref:hypothetical protein n=1 Tax=Streptomyces sp. NBC_01433 TaxID=2903864 RepID=UPI002258A937|nr:hypothetical protein [Streptomyces sp. NBC_01433]MCX4677496.1 hypothetical protein [Streptomyces sp. NBC_01433]